MNILKELSSSLSIQQIKSALKDTRLKDSGYLDSKVFENQMNAYMNEMNYSINDCIKMLKKVNGL